MLRGLLDELKRCPLVLSDEWPRVVDELTRQLPVLLAKAEELEDAPTAGEDSSERGARHHLLQGAAQPLFYLSARDEDPGDDSYETNLRRACRRGADALDASQIFDALHASPTAADWPEALRRVLDAARPLVLLRLGRKLRPRTERLRAARAAFDAFPRRSLCAALRVGAFPSSPSFVRGLAELGAGHGRFHVGVLEATPERKAWHASSSPREMTARPTSSGKRSRYEGFEKLGLTLVLPRWSSWSRRS